jgi:Bifunctional DNA primase/polymerase, N-terminal/Family of unknown function (DUF5906)/Primase C terminal 2 (PriCT-2)
MALFEKPTAAYTWKLAQYYKEQGIVTMPLRDGKEPIIKKFGSLDMNTAMFKMWQACHTDRKGGGWFRYQNIGIICGEKYGIFVVDVDFKDGGLDTWTQLIRTNVGPDVDPFTALPTYTVKTGNGGYHFYFKFTPQLNIIPTTQAILPGIDIRANDNGQVVAAGCFAWIKEKKRLDFTRLYTDDASPSDSLMEMPPWLFVSLYIGLRTPKIPKVIVPEPEPDCPDDELSKLFKLLSEPIQPADLTDFVEKVMTPYTGNDPEEAQLTKLVSMLSVARSDFRKTWLNVMFALKDKCTPENNEFRLKLWHEFSSKSPKYDSTAVTKLWNDHKQRRESGGKIIHLASLFTWAKQDSPDEYALFTKERKGIRVLKVDHHCQYSPDDEYYLDNLILQFNNKRYEADSREEGYEIIKTDLINAYARFIRHIHTAKGLIIYMKENRKNPFALSSLMGLESYKKLHCILKYEVEVKKNGQDPTKEIVYENIPIFRFIGISSDTLCIKSTEVICEPYHFDLIKEIDPDIFNIFPGYKARLVNNGIVTLEMFERIRPILKHIREVWACENNDLYYWILSWIAHPFVYLTKCGVALVVVGEQGCGKTIVFDFLEKWVIGELNIYTTGDIEEVTHHFNAHLKGITHCFINENAIDKKSGFAKVYTKLKNIITDSTITVTGKGKDTFREPNNMSLGFASNSKERPVHAEQGDRRYTITESSNKYKGNFAYFRDLADKCFNKETGDIFFTYLRSAALRPYLVDISKIPDTEARQTVLDKSRLRHEQFFSEVFNNGEIPINAMHILEIPGDPLKIFITAEILYETFKEWHKKMCFYGDGCSLETFQKALPKHPGIYKDDKVKHKPKGCESRARGVYIEENLYDTTMIDTRERDPVTAELLEPMTLREYVDRWVQGTSNKKNMTTVI